MSEAPDIQSPLDLTVYFGGIVADLTAHEDGVLRRLAVAAWNARPPGYLPSAPEALASLAGIAPCDWPSVSARVVRMFGIRDGMLHLPTIEAAALIDLRRASDRERQRRSRGNRQPGRCDNPRDSHSDSHSADSASSLQRSPSLQAPALLRTSEAEKSERLGGEGVIAVVGAGARALYDQAVAQAKRQRLRNWKRQRLEEAVFPWADEPRRTIHARFVSKLLDLPGCTPERVVYAIDRAMEMGADWQAKKTDRKPDGPSIVCGMLGGKRDSPPCDVPVTWLPTFERRYGKLIELIHRQAEHEGGAALRAHTPKTTGGDRTAPATAQAK